MAKEGALEEDEMYGRKARGWSSGGSILAAAVNIFRDRIGGSKRKGVKL